MIKIDYEYTDENINDIILHNIIISDKYKKQDLLEASSISWLKLNSNRNYQDLEQLFRGCELDTHIIAYRPTFILPDGYELNMPNNNNDFKPLLYISKLSCKDRDLSYQEVISHSGSYNENYLNLLKAGCIMPKNVVNNNIQNTNIINEQNNITKPLTNDEIIRKVINGEVKLKLSYYDGDTSIEILINDLKSKYSKEPEVRVCGKINEDETYGIFVENELVSPIVWIKTNDINKYKFIDLRSNVKIEK